MLLTKKPTAMLKFALDEKHRASILNHIESRSVSEFVTKILTFENNEFLEERTTFYKEIITKLGVNDEIFVLSNLSACVTETVEKCVASLKSNTPIKEFSGIFFNPDDITVIINNVMSEFENVSVYNAPILLTYLTNVPLNAPESEQLLKNFQKILESFIEKASEKLKVTRE